MSKKPEYGEDDFWFDFLAATLDWAISETFIGGIVGNDVLVRV